MIHYAQIMPTPPESGQSSGDSSDHVRAAPVAIFPSPPPVLQPPMQSGQAKPVTLAEIKYRLARKASLAAKKKLMEQEQLRRDSLPKPSISQPTASLKPLQPVNSKGNTSAEAVLADALVFQQSVRASSGNPLFAGLDFACHQEEGFPVSCRNSDSASSSVLSSTPSSSRQTSPGSTMSGIFPSSFGSASPTVPAQQRLVLPSDSSWPNCIEFISNQPSSLKPVNVSKATLSSAGWDVIPVTPEGAPFRIGKIMMKPEADEVVVEVPRPPKPVIVPPPPPSKDTASLPAGAPLMPVEDPQIGRLLQQRANSEDTLLKLYDYFDVDQLTQLEADEAMPKDSPVITSFTLKELNLPAKQQQQHQQHPQPCQPSSPLPPEPLVYPRKMSDMTTVASSDSPKRVHFAAPPHLAVMPVDEHDPADDQPRPKSSSSLASPGILKKADRFLHQPEHSESHEGRYDSCSDTQWSSDSDVSLPLQTKKKSFKDMLWR